MILPSESAFASLFLQVRFFPRNSGSRPRRSGRLPDSTGLGFSHLRSPRTTMLMVALPPFPQRHQEEEARKNAVTAHNPQFPGPGDRPAREGPDREGALRWDGLCLGAVRPTWGTSLAERGKGPAAWPPVVGPPFGSRAGYGTYGPGLKGLGRVVRNADRPAQLLVPAVSGCLAGWAADRRKPSSGGHVAGLGGRSLFGSPSSVERPQRQGLCVKSL